MAPDDATDAGVEKKQGRQCAGAAGVAEDVHCPQCNYNLRGLTSDRCPECGYVVDPGTLKASQIPWVRRKQIGRFRAYWQTVWLVTFRNKRFCEEIDRPVSYRHSQKFRWVSVLHAYLAPVLVGVAGYGIPTGITSKSVLSVEMLPLFHLAVAWYLCLAAMTGLPSYFFHPRGLAVERQNRAVAMSYYACAPLAWTPFAVACAALGVVVFGFSEAPGMLLLLLGALMPLGLFIVWWLDLIHIARRTLRRRTASLVLFAVALPILWLGVGVLIMVGIPLAILFVMAVVSSLG